MKILIKVTRDVLERSKMCGFTTGLITENCMLALAFRDLFSDACVYIDEVYLLGGIGWSAKDRIILPQIAVKNRDQFDSIQPHQRVLMSPFSFEIEVPEYVISKIGIGEIYRVLSESKTLELVM